MGGLRAAQHTRLSTVVLGTGVRSLGTGPGSSRRFWLLCCSDLKGLPGDWELGGDRDGDFCLPGDGLKRWGLANIP